MTSSGDRLTHRCPACGIVRRLKDVGYVPSQGYVPSPYRTPETSPFKPLPDEIGWEQESDEIVLDHAETPREKAQRERRERELLTNVDRVHVAALKEETRRVNQATALRGAAYLRNRNRLDGLRGAA